MGSQIILQAGTPVDNNIWVEQWIHKGFIPEPWVYSIHAALTADIHCKRHTNVH